MSCPCCGRRALLLGAGALAATGPARAQDAPWRVDVHHHLSPPNWLAAVKRAKLDNPPMDDWTPARSIEVMDQAGVATSITSPTSPQVGFLPAVDAAAVARDANEYAKRLMADHPGRFGMFAMLPLPYVDESLKEIAYVFDTLGADGIGTMTSYGDKWLGYPEFAPVFEELNRRRATVYTHPTGANCCVNVVRGLPDTAVEWGTDTTRTIGNLIFSGASQRYPDINFIFSHGGGALTAVAERFQIQIPETPPYKGKISRQAIDHELNRFFYDTAQIANAVTIDALRELVPLSQIVFGSDYPYRTPIEHVRGLEQHFGPEDRKAIGRNNAVRILPRLKPA